MSLIRQPLKKQKQQILAAEADQVVGYKTQLTIEYGNDGIASTSIFSKGLLEDGGFGGGGGGGGDYDDDCGSGGSSSGFGPWMRSSKPIRRRTPSLAEIKPEKQVHPPLHLTPMHTLLLSNYREFARLQREKLAALPPFLLNRGAFVSTPKPWQLLGVEWMVARERLSLSDPDQPGSGILADSMGLGKTFTMLMLIASHRPVQAVGGNVTLLVCPVSLIDEWQREMSVHCDPCDRMRVYVAHGTAESRRLRKMRVREFQRHAAQYNLILTSYNFVHGHVKLLEQCEFLRIVLDEAHQIRNEATVAFTALDRLQARFRWCLSGSPISNDLSDLHSLVKWLRFTPYSDDRVWTRYILASATVGLKQTPVAEAAAERTVSENMAEQLILRRTKDILRLPQCHTEYVHVSLTTMERTVYEYIWDRARQDIGEDEFRRLVDQHCDPKQIHAVLEKLLRVRQCCNHVSLVNAVADSASISSEESSEQEEKEEEEEEEEEAPGIAAPMLPQEGSSKTAALVQRLRQFFAAVPGGKCVIFSQWVKFLRIVGRVLAAELKMPVLQLDGSQQRSKRTSVQDMFARDPRHQILLASIKACSLGLNLQAASCVCVLEPWWNPQVEKQAIDRVHRLGQEREVFVFRFIVRNTVEERVYDVQQHKEGIADAILAPRPRADGSEKIDV